MGFAKNVSTTLITRVATIIFSLAGSIVVARSLGPEGKGILALLGAITGIAMQFGILGLNTANIHFSAKNPEKTNNVIGNSMWISFIGGGLLSLFIVILFFLKPSLFIRVPPLLLWITLASIPFLTAQTLIQSIMVGRSRITLYNVIHFANQLVLMAGTIMLLVLLRFDVYALVIFSTIITITAAVVYCIDAIRAWGCSMRFDFDLFKKSIAYSLKIYIAQFFYFLMLRSDIYLVGLLRSSAEAGVYSIAANYADLLFLIPSTIALILLPKMSENRLDKIEITNQVTRVTTAVMAFVCVASLFIFQPLVGMLFGKAYIGAASPMTILYPGIFFLSIETVMSMYIVGHTNIPWVLPFAWAVTSVLNIILNLYFIPQWGFNGAAISSTIAYGLISIWVWRLYVKRTKARFSDLFLLNKSDINLIKNHLLRRKESA